MGQYFKSFLMSRGISLAELGIPEFGLSRDDAMKGVALLRDDRVPILGGDVYLRRRSSIKVAYSNWHIEQDPSEERDTYLSRSWDITMDYIQKFPSTDDAEVIFSIIVPWEYNSWAAEIDTG